MCISCPLLSQSTAGSDDLDDCKCNAGFFKQYTFDQTGNKKNFNCYCNPGYYVNNTQCSKCQICDPKTHPGHYRSGCEKNSPGVCKPCAICTNPSQKRAGCGFLSEGVCKDRDELVRTPFCPVDVEEEDRNALSISVRQASGLGAYSFEQVFGTDSTGTDFVCSTPCDGVEHDSIQCDGPFACNVKTCAEKSTAVDSLPRACPVVIEEEDPRTVRDRKRSENCVTCRECGHVNQYFGGGINGESKYNYYTHWGGGCVRECSKLLCSENTIWDWTARRCKRCTELRDVRLCNKGDRLALSLETRSVTGNWPLLYFPECTGESASKKLETFRYGMCAVCDSVDDKSKLCPSASQYPAGCLDASVQCETCHRAGRVGPAQLVEVFKSWWYNSHSRVFEPLHCQIAACIDRGGGSWTGVGAVDRVCTRPCSMVTPCAANEVEVPCRLPHDARCEQVYPIKTSSSFRYADGEVNLLNEDTDMKHRRFASFENTLIVLGEREYEYQCVWNADGIFDSKASPAGLSNVLWKPGRSDDYDARGTQVCRVWDVLPGVELPLLPLQNTISASEDQESKQTSSRRMLVNTEAYVLSYRFGGAFAVADTWDVQGAFVNSDDTASAEMLRGAHVGGAGKLFLMLRLYQAQATVAVTVPSDRRLHEAMWLQAVLVSFAVADVTQYGDLQDAAVTVSTTVTADEKHISDLSDNFVLESFWVQNMSETMHVSSATAASGQAQMFSPVGDANGMFIVEIMDEYFNSWVTCNSTDALKLRFVGMQVAPFAPNPALKNYSWLEQRHGSAVPFNVSVACFKGGELQAASECHNAKDAAAVYVRKQPYAFAPVSLPAGLCPRCQPTSDRILLGLLHVQQHMRGVRADQHASSPGLVRYLLRQLSPHLQLMQASAWEPFGECAVLVTTEAQLTTEDLGDLQDGRTLGNAVLCVGADRIDHLGWPPTRVGERYAGAFGYVVGGMRQMILLLSGRYTRTTTLRWYDTALQATRLVNDTEGLSTSWISVCVESEQIVALGINGNNQLQVGFYTMSMKEELELSHRGLPTVLDVVYEIVEEPPRGFGAPNSTEQASVGFSSVDGWLSYGRVAACETGRFLVAVVRQEQVDSRAGQAGGTRLLLLVCAGRQNSSESSCASVTLPVAPASAPSFVSVAFLRASNEQEHWVVGVYGFVFAVDTAEHDSRVVVQQQMQSELRDLHFLKADPLFYTFGVSGSGASTSEVLTYLEGFERIRSNVSLPAAYGVVLVPPSRVDDSVEAEIVAAASGDIIYTPPEPVLNLTIYRASYHVETASGPGLPVYERTGELVAGNESTQLLVSPHAQAPFSQRRAGFIASYEGAGLNHRIALPHAYGRYEMPAGSQQCRFLHIKPQEQSVESGLRLHLSATPPPSQPWLLLQFEVPCGKRLLVSCALTEQQTWQVRCPAQVFLLLNPVLRQATLYHLEEEADRLVSQPQTFAECVYLEAGVAWVNSVAFANPPAEAELLRRLLRLVELQTPPLAAPVVRSWRRERHVLTLNPVENMRLEIRLARDPLFTSTAVSVGVDDVQLAPVLSLFPPLRGPDVLCALLLLPSAADLRSLGLANLVVDDHWRRVHVTVSLETAAPCQFKAHLYLAGPAGCPAPAEAQHGLERVGCHLQTDTQNVRGAYAECQLEVPLGRLDVGVVVRPETGCQLGANDSVVAWLRPYTALHSCPSGQFLDSEGLCSTCHDVEEVLAHSCLLGQRVSGCPALEHGRDCVDCLEGAELVAQGAARYVKSNTSICAWECLPGFFRTDDTCVRCSNETACAAGQRWQPCATAQEAREDARCVACDDLRRTKGSYAANEELVAGCETRCREGYYNDTTEFADGRCKRCWDRAELVLHASETERFFALFMCTETRNARWEPCPPEPGSRVVGSDTGAGTASSPFSGRCQRVCEGGWRRRAESESGNSTCVQCPHPRRIELGSVTQLGLPDIAFEWLPESCDFTCLPPYLSTRERSNGEPVENTCVLCHGPGGSFLCPDGHYPTGPYCQCETCERL